MERKAVSVFRGDRLRELRKAQGLTEGELAYKIGGKQQQIAAYETTDRYPRTDTLVKLVKVLGCSSDYLLDLADTPNGRVESLSGEELALLDVIKNGVSFEAIQALMAFLKGTDNKVE